MKQQKINAPKGLTKKQRSWIYTGFFIGLILVLFVVNNSGNEPERGPYPPNYVPAAQRNSVLAPDFALPTTDGKVLRLSDYRGKVVIIDFWATWCPPCRKGIPDLIDIKKKYGSKGVEIIGVSVDTDTKPEVIPFIKEKGINYPVVYGNQNVYMQYGGIRAIPTTFVIDKEGKIVASYEGLVPKVTYENHIKKILGL
ncbi:peroxiredoxin family protein [Rosettibacter firmus]|uniref:peroxiredoxin family protein n=1 Tax=Rosettibacter firmus TaxID=3111522 RepID=UPI00336BE67D